MKLIFMYKITEDRNRLIALHSVLRSLRNDSV
jgi:hypothetical protein